MQHVSRTKEERNSRPRKRGGIATNGGWKQTKCESVCVMLESYEFDKLCGPLRQEIARLRAHHAVCMQFKEELNLVLETNGVVCGVGR